MSVKSIQNTFNLDTSRSSSVSDPLIDSASLDQKASATFNLFLKLAFAKIEIQFSSTALNIKADFMDAVQQQNISLSTVDTYRSALMRSQANSLQGVLPELVIRALFQELYDILCEELGPVVTDEFVSGVLNQLENSPASKQYSMRNLL